MMTAPNMGAVVFYGRGGQSDDGVNVAVGEQLFTDIELSATRQEAPNDNGWVEKEKE